MRLYGVQALRELAEKYVDKLLGDDGQETELSVRTNATLGQFLDEVEADEEASKPKVK